MTPEERLAKAGFKRRVGQRDAEWRKSLRVQADVYRAAARRLHLESARADTTLREMFRAEIDRIEGLEAAARTLADGWEA